MKKILLSVIACILVGACMVTTAPPSTATEAPITPTLPAETSAPPAPIPTSTAEHPTLTAVPPTATEESIPTANDIPVAVFYYSWYRSQPFDGAWIHWNEPFFNPPQDISSDYFPLLGAYSSLDPEVVARHFTWLRGAGVDIVLPTWWGRGSREDQAVPLLLDQAEAAGLKIGFHIEPYSGRTAATLVDDVRYLYEQYGDHPAFFRTQSASRWSPDDRAKGLFFVWATGVPDTDKAPVPAEYWQAAVDEIHNLASGGIVIANTVSTDWIDGGHFDGLYDYATLQLEEAGGFSWARGLPPDAWYVPSVLPGFSARRIGYSEDTYVPRENGATYDHYWEAALGVGVAPAMITITSFNEWHEGSQIEPASPDAGAEYTNYAPLPPEGYLDLTRIWVDLLHQTIWPETYRARIVLTTTSDWTTFGLISGGGWLRPALVSASQEAEYAWLEGDRFLLLQSLGRAEDGDEVSMTVDLLLSGLTPGGALTFEIARGHFGATQVQLFTFAGSEPVLAGSLEWSGINLATERNTYQEELPADLFLSQP